MAYRRFVSQIVPISLAAVTFVAACGGSTTENSAGDGASGSVSTDVGGSAGTSSVGGSSSSGGTPGAGGTVSTVSGGTGPGAPKGDPDSCHVALRIDDCCNPPIVATKAEIEADECLVLYQGRFVAYATRSERCAEPPECATIDCASPAPPSRVAVMGETGCEFADECQTDADCGPAVDNNQCCSCPSAFPTALMESDPCVTPYDAPIDPSCRNNCATVLCEGCPELPPPPGVCSTDGAGLTRCL